MKLVGEHSNRFGWQTFSDEPSKIISLLYRFLQDLSTAQHFGNYFGFQCVVLWLFMIRHMANWRNFASMNRIRLWRVLGRGEGAPLSV